jgi:hypothetical protein
MTGPTVQSHLASLFILVRVFRDLANDPTIFLGQCIKGRHFCFIDIMPRYPESGHSCPEGTREDRQRMEEMVIYNLPDEFESYISKESQDCIGHCDMGQNEVHDSHC